MIRFLENSDGVHLDNPIASDYTLCGDTSEPDSSIGAEGATPTDKRLVTCPKCIAIIKACRGVRIKEK